MNAVKSDPKVLRPGQDPSLPFAFTKTYFPLPRHQHMPRARTASNSLEEQDVPRIDRANGLFDPVVECHESGMLGVGRLVERVVPGDPGVIFVVLRGWASLGGRGM